MSKDMCALILTYMIMWLTYVIANQLLGIFNLNAHISLLCKVYIYEGKQYFLFGLKQKVSTSLTVPLIGSF